LLQLQVS